MKKVLIYCDGSSKGNPGPGGWGVVIVSPGEKRITEISGSYSHATNNQMELAAAIFALSALQESSDVILCSDSQYLIKGMSEWVLNWVNGWEGVKNKGMWKQLLHVAKDHHITWVWVRSGSSSLQRRANELAQLAASAQSGFRKEERCYERIG